MLMTLLTPGVKIFVVVVSVRRPVDVAYLPPQLSQADGAGVITPSHATSRNSYSGPQIFSAARRFLVQTYVGK